MKFATPIILENYLENHFSVNASVDTVRFNPFTGEVGIEGVHIYGENGQELHLGYLLADLDLWLLFDSKLFVESLSLSSFNTQISQSENMWSVAGMEIPVTGDEASKDSQGSQTTPWQLGIGEINFDNAGVSLDLATVKSEFIIDSLRFNGAAQWIPEKISEFTVLLKVNGAPVVLKGGVKPFSTAIDLDLALAIDDLSFAPLLAALEERLPYNDIQAMLNAELQLAYTRKNQVNNIALTGRLSLADISFTDTSRNLYIAEEKVEWRGDVSLALGDTTTDDIQSLSTLDFFPLRVETSDTGILLGRFNRLTVTNIQVDTLQSINVDEISIQQVIAMKDLALKNDELLFVEDTRLTNIEYLEDAIRVGEVKFKGLKGNVVLNRNAALLLSEKMDESRLFNTEQAHEGGVDIDQDQVSVEDAIEITAQTAKNQGEQSPFSVRINNLVVGDESYIHFIDYSVSPFFETRVRDIDLNLKNIDTGNNTKWMDIEFDASIDDYGKISLKGKAQPFAAAINAKAKMIIENVALVPLSSYTGKYADLFIKRGSLSSKIDISIIENKLDVKNKISLNKLRLEPGNSEVSERWLSDLPMPLDLTLNVLRDKNDVIVLDIPVEGKVSDPDFHLQDIYNTAMRKAVKFAATYYLTQAVQPLGLVMAAGKLVGKAAQPRFEPLIFAPGSAKISAMNKKHLKKIAKLFTDRPGLSLTVCAVSVEKDWQVMKTDLSDEEKNLLEKAGRKNVVPNKENPKVASIKQDLLLKLAGLRGRQVKRYIVESSGLDPARILSCNAKVDENVEARPKVMLSL